MRRNDREITDIDEIEKIIAGARYMHLGMLPAAAVRCTRASWAGERR